MITKEQVRYLMKYYPVKVSQEEAKAHFDEANLDSVDRDYWQKAANVINEIALENK